MSDFSGFMTKLPRALSDPKASLKGYLLTASRSVPGMKAPDRKAWAKRCEETQTSKCLITTPGKYSEETES